MQTLGIITEYNPFHYGHLYHLKKSKEICNCDTVICVMNGNFMQRGLPAIIDKWSRTRMALASGVDMVIELPLVYGIRSAEYFSRGAISLLEATGLVDYLVFGSEVGDITPLKETANLLNNENKYFQIRLKKYLEKGFHFPRARELALKDYLNSKSSINQGKIIKVLTEPNNILGIEYIKALQQIGSRIKPLTIKRIGSSYHTQELKNNIGNHIQTIKEHDFIDINKIASASAIRKNIYQNKLKFIKKYLPSVAFDILNEEIKQDKIPINFNMMAILIISTIRKMNLEELAEYAEISQGLNNRIYEAAHKAGDLEGLVDSIKTKAYTRTRIQRNLLHILFNIKDVDFKSLDKKGPQYLRVLGVRKEKEYLLSKISKSTSLKLVINPSSYLSEINFGSSNLLIKSLSYDIMATDIYSLLSKNPVSRQGHQDFTTPIIKI